MTLDEMIDNEIRRMRRQVQPEPQPQPEVREGAALEKMIAAAMPAVIRDSKARKTEIAKINKQQQQQERAEGEYFRSIQPKPASGDGSDYEMSDPTFV